MPLPEIKRLGKNPTEDEKWVYYSEVYAWRIVRGWGKSEDTTCPIDPNGEWYNQLMVEEVVSRYRRILAAERYQFAERESRDADVQAQNEKYARGLAWRQGRLDAYDAIHHPERLAERRRRGAVSEPPIAAADLGVTASPSDTGGLQHVADALPERAAE